MLKTLLEDEDSATRWLAGRALSRAFDPALLDQRIAPHARLSVPSAQPPFGIRSGDARVSRERVKAGLALCHGRIDVNIGVAVRSAEAAGFTHVFVVGTRPSCEPRCVERTALCVSKWCLMVPHWSVQRETWVFS